MISDDHEELDRQLERSVGTRALPLTPSPAFTHAVMARVHADAEASAAPRPLAFPWRRALPGLLAFGVVAAVCVAAMFGSVAGQLPAIHGSAPFSLPPQITSVLTSLGDALHQRLGSLVIALLIALSPVALTRRLVAAKPRTIAR